MTHPEALRTPPVPRDAETSGPEFKRRSPAGVWLGLPLITLGIYHFVWYYKIHREMAAFHRKPDSPVAGPMLVLLFLSWTLVAPFVSYYRTGERIRETQRHAGLPESCNPVLGTFLMLLWGAGVLYYQGELNKIADSR
ncbi:DUF4234 domain-containing protein [Amycolatopsis sp. NPDC059021]|uniref:DUF4234 domain-containing protein n=1 Tax=Amycolatopsis sp. NPDC059021 TaxID=3346704 RepID=UPI0036700748